MEALAAALSSSDNLERSFLHSVNSEQSIHHFGAETHTVFNNPQNTLDNRVRFEHGFGIVEDRLGFVSKMMDWLLQID